MIYDKSPIFSLMYDIEHHKSTTYCGFPHHLLVPKSVYYLFDFLTSISIQGQWFWFFQTKPWWLQLCASCFCHWCWPRCHSRLWWCGTLVSILSGATYSSRYQSDGPIYYTLVNRDYVTDKLVFGEILAICKIYTRHIYTRHLY